MVPQILGPKEVCTFSCPAACPSYGPFTHIIIFKLYNSSCFSCLWRNKGHHPIVLRVLVAKPNGTHPTCRRRICKVSETGINLTFKVGVHKIDFQLPLKMRDELASLGLHSHMTSEFSREPSSGLRRIYSWPSPSSPSFMSLTCLVPMSALGFEKSVINVGIYSMRYVPGSYRVSGM